MPVYVCKATPRHFMFTVFFENVIVMYYVTTHSKLLQQLLPNMYRYTMTVELLKYGDNFRSVGTFCGNV